MSLRCVTSRPASCSGAMYAGVPERMLSTLPAIAARPKSVSRTWPSPSIITLAGFRSRCRTPFVRRRDPGADLPGDFDRLFLREAPDAAQQRRQILAVHVLHQDRAAVGVADVVG